MWSEECEVLSVKSEVQRKEGGVWSMECDVLSEDCEVWKARPWKVRSASCEMWNVRC